MTILKIYEHKKIVKFAGFPITEYTTHMHSKRKLRRRLKTSANKWNYFLTLTYSDDYVNSACSNDVRIFMNRLKQIYRNRIKKYEKAGRKHMANKYKRNLELFQYCWSVEFDSSGKRDYNPHFHILIRSGKHLNNKMIYKAWNYKGFTTTKKVSSIQKARLYVSKYMAKAKLNSNWQNQRLYGFSRNVSKKEFKQWVYVGILEIDDYFKLKLLCKDFLQNAYAIEFYRIKARHNKSLVYG